MYSLQKNVLHSILDEPVASEKMMKYEFDEKTKIRDKRLHRSFSNQTSDHYKKIFGYSSSSEDKLWDVEWPKEVKAWMNVFAMQYEQMSKYPFETVK